jgi:hypothetical protein
MLASNKKEMGRAVDRAPPHTVFQVIIKIKEPSSH